MGEVADMYTQDGTVDIKGNPAVKKGTGNWRACPYILANECCERLAYYGMSTNLVNYMKTRLGQGNSVAANNVTNWSGTCYITPLIGAFLADAYMGRYWTIASFMIIYIIGLALLTMVSSVKGLVPSCDISGTCHPTEPQTAAVFVALYLIALGTGGIKPCVSSFGADQFDENDTKEQKSKSSFFNWFYFSINIGALVASTVLVYVQTHVGWGWGFGIPAVVMAIAVVSFFIGTPLYRHQRPGGSPITRIAQVLVASARKWSVAVPADKSLLHETPDGECGIEGSRKLEHTDQFQCLDKAAVETAADRTATSPWRLCTVTQVEELKSVVRLLPIWATGIVFATVYGQMSTMFVLQGNTLDQRLGPKFSVPSATLSMVDTISVIIWVPIYDRVIVPVVRSYTGRPRGFTQLQRMGIGLVISIFSMVAAGVLDVVRLRAVARHGLYGDKDVVPISIFWQIPQYFIIGCAEVFTFVGQLEFFYDQAPDAMRSLCSALSLTTVALGNYLSTVLVTIVTRITTRHGKLGWIPDNLNLGPQPTEPQDPTPRSRSPFPKPTASTMAFRLSNNLIGILNAVTFLLSIPILGAGIWLRQRADGTECERYLAAPIIAVGVFLLVVSIAGLVGACCRVTWLLWVYLLAMFVLIVALFCFTVFAFVVTNRGAGEAVSGRGYKEYRLGDYSNWLQKRVENNKNWNRIRSCLQDSKVCKNLQNKQESFADFIRSDLSPIESGCCKPPTSCGFTYVNGTDWTKTTTNSTDPDCNTWSNEELCYGCQSCKAGVVATLKRDWKRTAIVCVVFLVFIIIVYSVGCCAFRNNRRDNAYRGGWKGGYA